MSAGADARGEEEGGRSGAPGSSATVSTAERGATVSTAQHVLVNLDCDNVLHTEWLHAMPKHVHEEILQGKGSWRFAGEDSGCTGRIGVLPKLFSETRGYDQSLPCPVGYQDIEFADRAGRCSFAGFKSFINRPLCGHSLPHHKEQQYVA